RERGLARAVGADERMDLAPADLDRHVVERDEAAPDATNAVAGQQDFSGAHGAPAWRAPSSRARSIRGRPIRPRGSRATQAMIDAPRPRCQWSEKPPMSSRDWKSSSRRLSANAPITAPRRWPRPPRMIITRAAPERCQESSSGLTKPSLIAKRKPAMPAIAPERTKAASW